MEWTNQLTLSGGEVDASDRAQGSVFFVGNATVILRYAGFTNLTDPNFLHAGDHVHLGHGMTAARRTIWRSRSRHCRRSTSSCCRICTRIISTARSNGSSTVTCPSSPRPTGPPI